MSYCRFSSNNWECDVYAYESDDGFIINVAASRFVNRLTPMPSIHKASAEEYVKAHQKQMNEIEIAKSIEIGLAFDGQTIICESEEQMFDELRKLADLGYRVPGVLFGGVL